MVYIFHVTHGNFLLSWLFVQNKGTFKQHESKVLPTDLVWWLLVMQNTKAFSILLIKLNTHAHTLHTQVRSMPHCNAYSIFPIKECIVWTCKEVRGGHLQKGQFPLHQMSLAFTLSRLPQSSAILSLSLHLLIHTIIHGQTRSDRGHPVWRSVIFSFHVLVPAKISGPAGHRETVWGDLLVPSISNPISSFSFVFVTSFYEPQSSAWNAHFAPNLWELIQLFNTLYFMIIIPQ